MAITKKDVERLKETFVTKEDLKRELGNTTERLKQELKQELTDVIQNEVRAGVSELRILIEDTNHKIELLSEGNQSKEEKLTHHSEKIENHEGRITRLEDWSKHA